jgi:4-hydroxybenzoate polyprenyltransferase
MVSTSQAVPADALPASWVEHAPNWIKPWARLARLDRPIGTWLLFWPCVFGLLLGAAADERRFLQWHDVYYVILFGIGALVMRGAGCTFNDIVDRDIDAQVARTRARPIPSGAISLRGAVIFLVAQCLVGLAILLQFNWFAVGLGAASLLLVAAYPFMKRITWWPQAWLGLVFSWGALVGWPAVQGSLDWPPLLLWLGSIAWVVGYDTLYAIQDIEDDALVGVKSSARRLGDRAAIGVAVFNAVALMLWGCAIWSVRPDALALLALGPAGLHLANQVLRADAKDGELALRLFRSNRTTGFLVFLGMLVVGLSSR